MQRIKLILLVAIVALSSCGTDGAKDDRPAITVSILPQKYFVEQLAGDNFKVNVLVPAGSGPETYEPTPAQMEQVNRSKIYFVTGYLELEQYIAGRIMSQNRDLLFVNTSENVDLIAAEVVAHGDHYHYYGVDPHFWLSIPEVKKQVWKILEALVYIDPDNKQTYIDNYNRFAAKVDDLNIEIAEKLAFSTRNSFVVFHPALGYFSRDYNLNQISIEVDGKSPSPAIMRSVIDQAKAEGIENVLIQMESERENAAAVARELGGRVIEIDPLGENWIDTMRDIANKLTEILN